MQKQQEHKLGTLVLTALVIGTIIGSGIFSLPQNMAEGAGAGAILIAWVITFVGMLALTKIFQWLALNRSDIHDGVYGYVRHGFGDYIGFNAAWGYWISVWVGNVSYLVLMFSALGSFAPLHFFAGGDTLPALLGSLVLLWSIHGLVLKGVRSASMLNLLVTIAKIVPLGLFVLCVMLAFKSKIFVTHFWGAPALGSVLTQVKTTMLFTVWVFLGIECASVYANRAKSGLAVSRATLIGFAITFLLFVCISVLSLGIVPQPVLAQMQNPSMAGVLAYAYGPWAGIFINCALLCSILGALLAWMLISSEMLYLAARGDHHTAPSCFGRLNSKGVPANVLWLSNGLISLFLIINYVNDAGYNVLIQLASAMVLIPYLFCALYCLKLAISRRQPWTVILLAVVGSLYGVWLIYAGNLQFILWSMLLYSLGLPFYLRARYEMRAKWFNHALEGGLAIVIVLMGIYSALHLITG